MYNFDSYGWYTDNIEYQHRIATQAPDYVPESKIVGQEYPNWSGYAWVMVPYTEVTELIPDTPISTPIRHIQVGALYDRLGDAKWAILADTNPGVQALIKDCTIRKFIDLDNPQLYAGLSMLEESGHQIDKDSILNQPIQKEELP